VLTADETREELEWFIDVYDHHYGLGMWATLDKETGEFIGRCGLIPWLASRSRHSKLALTYADEHRDVDATYEVEVAYLLAKEHWRKRLATEAARAIVAYAVDRLRLRRLICLVDPDNVASRSVASKIGMSADGDVDVDGHTLPLFSMTCATLDDL
jgi:ribosomal-protein-alanine N-acetyltransferase